MIDIKALSIAELEALVSAEKSERKADAARQINELATAHGFTLSELLGGSIPRVARKAKRKHGETAPIIHAHIRAGMKATDIAEAVGWGRNANGGIYDYARKIGFKPDGKGAFVPASPH